MILNKTIETIDKSEDLSNFLLKYSSPGSFPTKLEFTEFSTTKSSNLSVTTNVNINIIQKTPQPNNEESDTSKEALNEINEFVKSFKDGNFTSETVPKNVLKF